MQIPGGMLADRFGPAIVIAAATVGWGFFQAIAAVCTGWVTLLVTRLGLGAAEAPIYPAGGKLNGIWMTQNERGRGATLLDGGAPLGAALGAILISGLIAGLDSWRLSFIVAGVGTILAGCWCLELHPQPPAPASRRQRGRGPLHRGGACRGRRRVAGRRQRPRAGLLPLPLGVGHVLRLDVLQRAVLRPADLDAELPVQGARLRHQADGRRGVHHVLLRLRRRDGRRLDLPTSGRPAGGSPTPVLRTLFGVASVIATVSIFSCRASRTRSPSSSCCRSRCSSCAGAACSGASRRSSAPATASASSAAP